MPIVVMLIIFLFSSEVSSESSGRSIPLSEILHLPEWLIRKSAHFFIFGLLGASWYNVFRANKKLSNRAKIIIPVILAAAYAALDELHQLFVPGRSGQLSDILLDSVAGLIFVLIFVLIDSKIRKSRAVGKELR